MNTRITAGMTSRRSRAPRCRGSAAAPPSGVALPERNTATKRRTCTTRKIAVSQRRIWMKMRCEVHGLRLDLPPHLRPDPALGHGHLPRGAGPAPGGRLPVPGARPPKAVPRQVRGSAVLEIIWTLIPAVILTLHRLPDRGGDLPDPGRSAEGRPPRRGDRAPVVVGVPVPGARHRHRERAPPPGRTAGEPRARQPSTSSTASGCRSLGGKRDVDPRPQPTASCSRADAPGEYYGQCAEFCGASHANMRHAS